MGDEETSNQERTAAATRHLIAPELRAWLDAFPDLPLSDEFIAMLRQGGAFASAFAQPATPPALAAVRCSERYAPGIEDAPDVRVLVYQPALEPAASGPAYLHIHGGGYVLGAPEINDASNRALVAELGCVVVSVDYRLAPETAFPGALHDCYAALSWLRSEADALAVDPERIAIGGESAGGGHAAALALYARDRGEIVICFQMLDSPMLDDRTGSGHEPHLYCGEFVWTPEKNRYGWRALLGLEPGGADVPSAAVPARAASLDGLPPTFIAVGGLDLFLEENLEYARRLSRAGVPTELHVLPGAFHGFGAAGGDAPQVQSLLRLRNAALARAFAGLA